MKLRFLGTGTSTGVPALLCDCPVCRSDDPRDRRSRTSALLTTPDGKNLLIDCGPDFRTQALDAHSPKIDALIITHHHYDHVGGIDDLRPYCHHRASADGDMPVYGSRDVIDDIHRRLPYCFGDNLYPGVPTFDRHEITPGKQFTAAGTKVMPIAVRHGEATICGFRIGSLGYITDCSTLPDESLTALHGIDTLVINALRMKPHRSHMNLEQALTVIRDVNPRRAWLIHMSHDIGLHSQTDISLPQGVNLAYDGLVIEIPD